MKFDVEKLMSAIKQYIDNSNAKQISEQLDIINKQQAIIDEQQSTVKSLTERLDEIEKNETTFEIDETAFNEMIDKSLAEKMNINIEYDDERTITVTVNDVVKSFEIPVQIYKGVHVENDNYKKGDTVTHQGGIWHCKTLTNEKPGDSEHWQLAVKSGRK